MRVVEFELSDSDGVANGGVDTSYGAINVFVTDQNEGYVSTPEDTPYVFSSSDFGFTGFLGNMIDTITITTAVQRIKAKHILVMIDSCYLGTSFKGKQNIINYFFFFFYF